jgi:hypothetical protein
MQLQNLIEVHLDLPRLAKDLDELGHAGRLWAVNQWTRANMATLWDAVKGLRPLTLDDFVPPAVAPYAQVVHHGKNSLPAITHFQKRFARPKQPPPGDGSEPADLLIGFNVQAFSAVTGPGYFVAYSDASAGAEAGEVALDHTQLPKEQPQGWPALVPNSARLGRFVYAGIVDVVRGLSSHVSIGRVRRAGGWLDAWFLLVREDAREDMARAS